MTMSPHVLLLFLAICYVSSAPLKFGGTNLAGADFGEDNLPGEFGTHYTYPTPAEVDYFLNKGFNTFRIPFRWERIQRQLFSDFDSLELSRLLVVVKYATNLGANVILDPHNYARYHGNLVGSGQLPFEAFADFWARLAQIFNDDERVIFGLVNEPHTMPTEVWLQAANSAIGVIRQTGARNLILVPGNAWSGAHSWLDTWYGTPNGAVMHRVTDPIDNFAYDMHQYLDIDSSGTHRECVAANIGQERLNAATNWLRANNRSALIGEFAGDISSGCLTAVNNMLNFMEANTDVWIGYTWWAAGPWWGEYMFTLEPTVDGRDRPQMAVLLQHLPEV